MSVQIQAFTFNGFQENTYVVSMGQDAVIFDPGCYTREEEAQLFAYINENSLDIKAILFTHAHIDHILGASFCQERFQAPAYLHAADQLTWESVKSYAHVYGFENYKEAEVPIYLLEDQKEITFDSLTFKVYHTPGHAPGHVVFYHESGFVINGDVLFKGSFGRVDLPGGDLETLKKSIFEIMFKFPEQTVVYCGHGPATTIGQEKRTNYILEF
ncbi:MAG: MBL fold metallo-hydrolase [Crocinitomicaceae bacterium]|jgi:hydroxyacylglutathione hydrolase|nr:MBL fold metallo-hydrolase [Crocinitomicaceae bacterium]MDP4724595.1 MBL fold metallo-hydrolase [Crocinitomicaceae bacterium]MDP4799197.1 MBL fold metallo-hydrolase [Crocinitomicaceae bacterium]MDP4807042.1 MBL fold metallo-hydrolase [Crocinitomicaceae bacterium]MDP4867832.1 MBL fold metallo-hydrolase [Crocinitomicaceae bacterium]